MAKVLTIKYGSGRACEVHMLNVGEVFPNFGGSRHGRRVTNGASMITRYIGMTQTDTDRAISDKEMWAEIARLINGGHDAKAEVEA